MPSPSAPLRPRRALQRLRFAIRIASVVMVLAAMGGNAFARQPLERPPKRVPYTSIEHERYGAADLVVVGRIRRVRNQPGKRIGPQLITLDVEEVIKDEASTPRFGPRDARTITMLVRGHRTLGQGPRASNAPLFVEGDRSRHVFFLGVTRGKRTWVMDGHFAADGREADEKVKALRGVRALRMARPEATRGERTLQWLLTSMRARGRWTRDNAARELAWLAANHPLLFDADAKERLADVAAGRLTAGQEIWIERVFRALRWRPGLARGFGSLPSDRRSAGGGTTWRRDMERATTFAAQLQLMRERFDDRARDTVRVWHDLRWGYTGARKDVRTAWLRYAGDEGTAADHEPLRRMYATEDDIDVRAAIVRAVGQTGGAAAVPWLVARLQSERLWDAAMLALARIRTADALRRLRQERKTLVDGARREDKVRIEWIDHLLSASFRG